MGPCRWQEFGWDPYLHPATSRGHEVGFPQGTEGRSGRPKRGFSSWSVVEYLRNDTKIPKILQKENRFCKCFFCLTATASQLEMTCISGSEWVISWGWCGDAVEACFGHQDWAGSLEFPWPSWLSQRVAECRQDSAALRSENEGSKPIGWVFLRLMIISLVCNSGSTARSRSLVKERQRNCQLWRLLRSFGAQFTLAVHS